MSFTRQDLMDMNKLWGDSGDGGPDAAEVPEAKYQARVVGAELMKSSSGRPQCRWRFKIVGGEEKAIGKVLDTYDGLETPINLGYFKKKLKRMQIALPTDFEEIPDLLKEAIGAVIEIQVKYKDDFLNVYVNKLVEAGTGELSKEDMASAKGDGKAAAKGSSKSKPKDEEEEDEDKEEKDEDDDKPAKGKSKADEDEDDEKDEDKEEEDEDKDDDEKPKGKKGKDEEEEEDDDKPASRNFPTLAELDKTPEKGLRKVLKEFKVAPAEGKKESLLRGVAKVLVSVMEDDDHEPEAGIMRTTCKWLGIEPEDDQSVKKMLKQVIKHLGG